MQQFRHLIGRSGCANWYSSIYIHHATSIRLRSTYKGENRKRRFSIESDLKRHNNILLLLFM